MREADTTLVTRESISSIYQIKLDLLDQYKLFDATSDKIDALSKRLNGYSPYHIDRRFENYDNHREEKYIDRICWNYLVNLFELHKYMLCTDYEKVSKQVHEFNFPNYTIENARGWISGLKDIIYDNVNTLIKSVFTTITSGTYYTGSGYSNREKKKRNNNGVDSTFILQTYDYSDIFGYHHRPTVTDDLEKVSYIMDGKTLPEFILKDRMRKDKVSEANNEYFSIRVCKNGNTHYHIKDMVRDKLNIYGPSGAIIGEDLRIKVFE